MCLYLYVSVNGKTRMRALEGGAREFASGGLGSCGLLTGAGCYVYLVYAKDPFSFLYFIDNRCNCILISNITDSEALFPLRGFSFTLSLLECCKHKKVCMLPC